MRSRYSNFGEIFIMMIGWAVVLAVLTKSFTPAEEPGTSGKPSTTPQVRMMLRHVGCNEQLKTTVLQALTSLQWLSTVEFKSMPQKPTAHAEEAKTEEPCTTHLTALVQVVEEADFIQLIETLHTIGIAPKNLTLAGLPRFALVARVADMSCESCTRAAFEALTPLGVSVTYYATTNQGKIDPSRITSLGWIGSKSLDREKHTITATVRSNRAARIDEMIRALEGAGLFPLSVRIMVTTADKA
ncbi:MAG: hypothetical protein V3R80_11915 [Candidatus Tectomicrobia bacterium]